MSGDFAVNGPATSAAATPSAAPTKQAAPTGHAANFRTVIEPHVKAMRDTATELSIPQVVNITNQFLELVERSAKIMEA